jgi:hypothetical protein
MDVTGSPDTSEPLQQLLEENDKQLDLPAPPAAQKEKEDTKENKATSAEPELEHATRFYRIVDKIENLCVRVRLRKKAASVSMLNDTESVFSEEIIAKWQEKVDTIS